MRESPKSEGRGEGKGEGKAIYPHVYKCPVHRALRPKSEGVRVKQESGALGSRCQGGCGQAFSPLAGSLKAPPLSIASVHSDGTGDS